MGLTRGGYAQGQRLVSGQTYGPTASAGTASRPNGFMTMVFYSIDFATTFDRIGCDVTTAGEASSVMRLGIYADNNGTPGALILDAGTVTTATTGIKTITISQKLAPGRYWLAALTQAAATTQPTCRSYLTRVSGAPVSTNYAVGAGWSNSAAGQGALPNPAAASAVADTVLIVNLRVG